MQLDLLRELFSRNAGAMRLIEEASRRPQGGLPLLTPDENATAIENSRYAFEDYLLATSGRLDRTWIPQIDLFESAALLFIARAKLRTIEGDGSRAIDDFETVDRLCVHLSEKAFTPAFLLRCDIESRALHDSALLVHRHPEAFHDADLVRLGALFDCDLRTALTVAARSERTKAVDSAQYLYSAGGHLLPSSVTVSARDNDSGLALKRHLSSAIGALIDSGLDANIRRFDVQLARLERTVLRDPWEIQGLHGAALRPGEVELRRHWLVRRYLPPLRRLLNAVYQAQLGRAGLAVAITMERHRRSEGGWPTALSALSDTARANWPADLFTGDPLALSTDSDVIRVYSVGHDRDDDGGVHAPAARKWLTPAEVARRVRWPWSRRPAEVTDADFVIWPPQP